MRYKVYKELVSICMPKPHGYYVAGSGWRRTYANERNAYRAFNRLLDKGYECGMVCDSLGYAILVSRYSTHDSDRELPETPVQTNPVGE